MNDAIAGHVPLSIGSVFVTKPHIDSKRMRAARRDDERVRSPNLPDVPTMAESGFAGFDAPAWWAVLAPAKTPPEIVKRMNEEGINAVLKLPDVASRLAAQGIDVRTDTSAGARSASSSVQIDVAGSRSSRTTASRPTEGRPHRLRQGSDAASTPRLASRCPIDLN